jgi:hypothetical protein
VSAARFSRPTRSRPVALLAALALLAGLSAPFAAARANDVAVRHTLFGMHDASFLGSGLLDEGSVRLWDVGTQWRDVETVQGVYNWARLDAVVAAAQAAHQSVTMVVAGTPSFYASSPTDPPSPIQAYKNFVKALMNRYGGQIDAYQVWNEANISTFWTASMLKMAKLSKAMHDVRDQVDPQAQVIAPSMVSRLPYQQDWLKQFYAQKLHGTPVWRFFDALAFSLYPLAKYGSRTGVPEDTIKLLQQVRKRLHSDGVPGSKPIWNTEVNYGLQTGSKGGHHADTITDARQAANVIRTYLLNAARGVKRVFWYRYDMHLLSSSVGGGTIGNTRLSDPNDSTQVTPAGRAYALVQQWMHGKLLGSHGKAPCQTDSNGTYTCKVKDSSGTRRIYWNPFHQAKVKFASNAGHLQNLFGSVSTVNGGSKHTVDYRPVMVSK